MQKVIKFKDCQKYEGYSEQYEVYFWIKSGEYWHKKNKMYCTQNKGMNREVTSFWENEYKDKQVELIKTVYQ